MRWRAMSSSSSKNVKASNRKNERQHEHREIREESSQQVQSISKGQLPPEGSADALCTRLPFAMRAAHCPGRARCVHGSAASGVEASKRFEPAGFAAELLHAREQHEACESEHGVGDPHADGWWKRALACHSCAHD